MGRGPEGKFQDKVRERLKRSFEGCTVVKMDAFQGIPDLLVLVGERWAMLEVKQSAKAPHRPNQDHFVGKFNDQGFAAFIYPENEEEVFRGLSEYFS